MRTCANGLTMILNGRHETSTAMNFLASSRQLRASVIRWALICVPVLLLLGALSGTISGRGSDEIWFAALRKPIGYPSPEALGVVWCLLYSAMGIAVAIVLAARGANGRRVAVASFVVQLLINLAWSPLFYGGHLITEALIVIFLLDIALIITVVLFARVRPAAAWLLSPYLAWVLFATYLNISIWLENSALDGVHLSGAVQHIEF